MNRQYAITNLILAGLSPDPAVRAQLKEDFDAAPEYETRIVYISGPITGEPLGNSWKFKEAGIQHLRKNPLDIVINPNVFPHGLPYDFYMEICLRLLDECTHIIMLDGWKQSSGAKIEYDHAMKNGIVEIKIGE